MGKKEEITKNEICEVLLLPSNLVISMVSRSMSTFIHE